MRYNDARTFEFCFDGIEQNKTVSVGTHGCIKKKRMERNYTSCYEKNTTSRTYKKDGLIIRFDKEKKGAGGYGGKDHYHILNPEATGKHNYYLDKNGNPVPKNSKASHIIP